MKNIFLFLYTKFFKSQVHTKVSLSFKDDALDLSLDLQKLDENTAKEIAEIFYILQNGVLQTFLVDKICDISNQRDPAFLESVYANFNRISNKKMGNTGIISNKKHPMVRPLLAFSGKINQ